MPKADNGRNLVLEIKLSELRRIVPLNESFNRSKDKRPYHGLMR